MRESDILAMDAAELERQVRHHNALYWVENRPEIPDETFDLLVRRLRELAPASPALDELGEERAATAGTKVRHAAPMLSLEKAYSEAEIRRFYERFGGVALASPKVDGLAVSIRYGDDGALSLAATRGSGSEGDDVTAAVRQVGDVPHHVPASGVEVRGEVYLPLSTFRARYAGAFANPRNLAAGALKQKDPTRTAAYGLRFAAYDLLGASAPTETAKRALLEAWGFVPVPAVPATADDAQAVYERFAAERDALDYETDGVVFKVDDVRAHDELGATAHHPRYAIAYKYQGESGITTLAGVEWSVSRTGAINPVALLEPITLSGVTVTRVSLHNLGIMEQLARMPVQVGDNLGHVLSSGAQVLVTRRGGVIPHIEAVAEPGSGNLGVPTACPSCGARTERRDDTLTADHAPTCAVQQRRQLQHFVNTVDMQGFGPRLLEQLCDLGWVRSPADLYRLDVTRLATLDRMGEKSASNLVAAAAARRLLDPAVFVAALGIPDVGQQVARSLVAHYPDLAALRAASPEQLVEIDGIGPIVAARVVEGLALLASQLDDLLHVVRLAEPETAPTEGQLAGASFVFTGALDSMARSEAQARVRAAGGTTPDAVTASTDFLVLGDADHERFVGGWRSSKLKKAEQLAAKGGRLRIISESEFLAMTATTP